MIRNWYLSIIRTWMFFLMLDSITFKKCTMSHLSTFFTIVAICWFGYVFFYIGLALERIAKLLPGFIEALSDIRRQLRANNMGERKQ